jgi:ADP-ribose pyrophosphatase YjhB (NUDIX family)
VSIDNVIFGYHQKELKVLLQRPAGLTKWMLPGGYIRKTETIDEAASRITRERTSLNNLFLKQFKAFGNPGRSKDSEFSSGFISRMTGSEFSSVKWLTDYFVSLGYYALTEFEKVKPNGDFFMEECQWWDINDLPSMMFDHKNIIKEAMSALRLHIYHFPVGDELLPEKFSLPEIRGLYETILDRKLDPRNFSKKMISSGIIRKLEEKKKIGAHRSPFLYVFNEIVYKNALGEGITLFI